MRDAIALNTNYDEKAPQSFVMWGLGGGGDDIFTGWDSGWDAITAITVDPGLAIEHENDLFDRGGPRYEQLNAGPMHAYAVARIFAATGNRALVEKAYGNLKTFFDNMPEFDVDKDGLLESPYMGDRVGGRGNHLGLDDSPVYAEYQKIEKQGGSGDPRPNTNLTDVALNSYYALMARSMSKLALALDRPADVPAYDAVFDAVHKGMNSRLWNDDRNLYLSRYLDGSWQPAETPTVFYPLFGGVATPERAEQLVDEHLLNPDEFWGENVIPSVSRSDPKYCSNGEIHETSPHYTYFQEWDDKSSCEEWMGAAWPPMNATVYDGLKRYGFDDVAGQLATKSTDVAEGVGRRGLVPGVLRRDPRPGHRLLGDGHGLAYVLLVEPDAADEHPRAGRRRPVGEARLGDVRVPEPPRPQLGRRHPAARSLVRAPRSHRTRRP